MALSKHKQKQTHGQRQGFTLVEMMVSVTLVLLMMTMFTSIFQMATNSVTVQRGIAENDQAARTVTTALRADFAKRTFRYGQPYFPLESALNSPTPFGDRSGYLYMSMNDPNSWQDDILQFTVNVNQTQEEADDTKYFGAAKLLYDLTADPAFNDTPRRTTLRFNPNQPDADDANLFANNVASSSAAEISYFVRNGSLYRRVMLLREPLPVAGDELAIQPTSTVGGNLYVRPGTTHSPSEFGGAFAYVRSLLSINQTDGSNVNHFDLASGDSAPASWNVTSTNDFWRHFDMSAVPVLPASAPFLPTSASFVGIDALDNSVPLASTTALGNPIYRFGFNPLNGFSREHDNPANMLFIGRFLQAETSSTYFNYPLGASRIELDEPDFPDAVSDLANINKGTNFLGDDGSGTFGTGNGNPMDLTGTYLHLNQTSGVLTELQGESGRGGSRRVEDLLLANVHGMKVEIWDSRLERFVSPSHGSPSQFATGAGIQTIAGDYHAARNLNAAFGPHGPRVAAAAANKTAADAAAANNHVFDSWNPTVAASAPFIPYRYYPPRQSDGVVTTGGSYIAPCGPGPSVDSMPNPYDEYDRETGLNEQNKGYWVPSDFSDIDPGNWNYHTYQAGDVVFAPFTDTNANGDFDWVADAPGIPAQAFQIAYVCIQSGYAGDALTPPSFSRVPGQRFSDRRNTLAAGDPAVWRSIDNRQPLRSIRVTVQFYDQKTEKLRQLGLVLPVTTDR